MRLFSRYVRVLLLAAAVLTMAAMGLAQSDKPASNDKSAPAAAPADKSAKAPAPANDPEDPLKRQLSKEQMKKQTKAFKKEVSSEYKKWLDEDVRWIITDDERAAFKALSNDDEREQFIETFWGRRDPTPDTVENEFKEEHYRRIAYANEHFAAGMPGWKTDRGEIYIKFGPPDQIEDHPTGGTYNRPIEEGGGTTSTFPFQTWRYRYLEGRDLGNEVIIEFVDTCMCGAYHRTIDRSEKDALLRVPGAGQTLYEQLGMASQADRFTGGGYENIGKGPMSGGQTNPREFQVLAQYAALSRAPSIKFKELEEVVTTKIRYNLMPFDLRIDFVKVTEDTVLVPITIQVKNSDITFSDKEGIAKGTVNIFGRITNLTGKIIQTFEDTVALEVPSDLREKTQQKASVYWKALPLRSGRYRLDVVVKDVASGEGRLGTWRGPLTVPNFAEDKGIASSTLIMADQMEKVPSRTVGAGNFVIGDTRVRPRVNPGDGKPASFKRTGNVNFWMQVYNLGLDEKTQRPSAEIEYEIVNTATNKSVVQSKETTEQLGGKSDQVTLEKTLSLASLEPGTYQLTIKVNDRVSKQSLTPQTAKFAVEQ